MEKIGRYEILGELGRGGCGVVYRALDPGIGRTVAIKTIRVDSEASDLRERFRREARSAGILSHPNIVTIHEFNDSGDVMFIAMEYIDGQSLDQRMREGLAPVEFTLAIIRAAADALDFAHAHNIVHRDVKPANFLITKLGHVKMADFGIAKLLDSDVSLTNTGMVVGTAQYMSPEQIAAREVTGRSDQFSLAVIAYEMLTGQRPFQGNSWASMMHAIIATEPPPVAQHRKELGDEVTDVLRKALAKDPDDRYDSCKAFANALEHSVLGTTAEQTAFIEGGRKTRLEAELADTLMVPSGPVTKLRTATIPAGLTTPTTTREVPPPSAPMAAAPASPRHSWAVPVVTGAVIVIGLGAWLGLRSKPQQEPAAQAPAASVTGASQDTGASPDTGRPPAGGTQPTPAPTAQTQSAANAPSRPTEVRSGAASQSRQPAESQNRSSAFAPAESRTPAPFAAATSTPPPPAPAPAPTTSPATSPTTTAATTPPPPPPAQQPTPAPKAVEPPPVPAAATPAPIPAPQPAPVVATANPAANPAPAPAPARTPDPAEAAAQRRAAELQAARKTIAEAVNRYRQAFEARDLEGLKAVWPGLGRNEQNSFQNFFRIARTVKLQLTPVGDPEITATGATARYRRSMSATDERGALPAQDQTVKITFRKSGEQMLIDAIDAAGR